MAKKEELQKYQWIKSERTTEVVQVAEEQPDNTWVYFTDGSRVNASLISEFLIKVSENTPLGTSIVQNDKTTSLPNVSNNTTVVDQPVQTETKETTVMGKMIMKMSKKNVVNVPVQININIPTPQLYAMLSDGMEADDLNEEIMEVALQQIEINKLKEYITANVSEFLSEYYS